QICRNPWCDAPVRHIDHVKPVAEGGVTTAANLQGLCEACNHAKQAPGWRQRADLRADGTHVVETVTPAGRRCRSRPPPVAPPAVAFPSWTVDLSVPSV